MATKRQNIILRCDKLFRELVLISSDNTCQATGLKGVPLQAHHLVVKRRALPTRWLLSNGVSLSINAHSILEHNPIINEKWGRKLLGDLEYLNVIEIARIQVPIPVYKLLEEESRLKIEIAEWKKKESRPDFWAICRKTVLLSKFTN